MILILGVSSSVQPSCGLAVASRRVMNASVLQSSAAVAATLLLVVVDEFATAIAQAKVIAAWMPNERRRRQIWASGALLPAAAAAGQVSDAVYIKPRLTPFVPQSKLVVLLPMMIPTGTVTIQMAFRNNCDELPPAAADEENSTAAVSASSSHW
ncbi:hypothetical protein ACLKA6_010489 [Drosophila palustris]